VASQQLSRPDAPEHTVVVGIVLDEHLGAKGDAIGLEVFQQAHLLHDRQDLLHVDGARAIDIEFVKERAHLALPSLRYAQSLLVVLRHTCRAGTVGGRD